MASRKGKTIPSWALPRCKQIFWIAGLTLVSLARGNGEISASYDYTANVGAPPVVSTIGFADAAQKVCSTTYAWAMNMLPIKQCRHLDGTWSPYIDTVAYLNSVELCEFACSGGGGGDIYRSPHCPSNAVVSSYRTCTCNADYIPDAIGTGCVLACPAPSEIDPKTGKCEPPETYSIAFEKDNLSATIEPSGTAAQNAINFHIFTATVTSNMTQQPKAGAKVTIKADVAAYTGGHNHDDANRPKGDLYSDQTTDTCDNVHPGACITGLTDGNGKFVFAFIASEVSGTHTATASCDVCKGSEDKANIAVKVSGLVSLSANSTDYVLVGATTTHADNHYLTSSAKTAAEMLAKQYHRKFPNDPPLHFNDASLIEGGIFDICTEHETTGGCATASYRGYVPLCELQPNGTYSCSWSRPHAEHRRGSVIDVRANNIVLGADNYATSIPQGNEQVFLEMANQLQIKTGKPHSPKSSNRHWHLKLLGVAE